MKRYILSLAAMAAMVGCQSTDEPLLGGSDSGAGELLLNASIVTDDTRVTVDGEKFTDVKWERGDIVRLTSAAGLNTEMITTESGDTDVCFRGDGDYLADEDTYYAIYPSVTVKSGAATFDLTKQDGTDVAILAARAENAAKGVIDMDFYPINALLHVAVTGAPAIAKAEFVAYDGSSFATGFKYDLAADEITTTTTAAVLTLNNPNAAGFFFSLPADLDMSAGYIVRLTDSKGNICSKAYNGKIFAKGTTTRVEIAWSQPTVTLGEPMTSYSYYKLPANQGGGASVANSKANNVIYFPNASTYANVQNAMVTKACVVVKQGSTIVNEQEVTFANNSFGLAANVTVSSWGEYTVYAYITTRDGKTIKSPEQKVYITGLPYEANWFNSNDTTGWSTTGKVKFNDPGYGYRTMYHYLDGVEGGAIFSPSFNLPENVNIHYDIKACYHTAGSVLWPWDGESNNLIAGVTSGTTVPSSTQTKKVNRIFVAAGQQPSESQYTTGSFDSSVGNGQRIYISDSHIKHGNGAWNYFVIGRCNITYR